MYQFQRFRKHVRFSSRVAVEFFGPQIHLKIEVPIHTHTHTHTHTLRISV
jgi:hypothetical protein